jgi:hypothetical protein
MNRPYPAVRFVVRHGNYIAAGVPVLVLLAGAAGLLAGSGAWLAVGATLAAAVLFCVLRVFVELVQIIAETLIPQ